MVLLSATGLLLQHVSKLGLDSSFIGSARIIQWYGIEIPAVESSYNSGTNTVSLIEDTLFLNGRPLSANYFTLRGLVNSEFGSVIATDNQLLLLSEEGELIEALGSVHGVPDDIISVGLGLDIDAAREVDAGSRRVFLRLRDSLIEADLDALNWTESEISPNRVSWSEAAELNAAEAELIRERYAASLLSWERIVLDVHSGRMFGQFGVLLMDLMAILFLFMAITGVWIWSRRRSKI